MEQSRNGTALVTRGIGILGILGIALCMTIALVSYRYLIPGSPVPDVIAGNRFRLPFLVVHAASGATALLVGPWQFRSKLRARAPRLHRWLGRAYAVACLVGGASGLMLALGASTGPISTAGFGLLAIAWIHTTAQGWRTAMQRDFAAHRQWMIRSFALTLAAVTLRIWLPLSIALQLDMNVAYRAISFLCWVPNLLVAEAWLRRQSRARKAWAAVTSPGNAAVAARASSV